MDDTFEIGIEVTGEGAAARAFENLKLREMEAKEAASALSRELRDLKTSGEASDAQIEEVARSLIRAKQAASQYATEARNTQRSTRDSTEALSTNAHALQGAGRRWGELAGALGTAGSAVSTLSPQLGQLGGVLGTIGSAAGALEGALGPVGIAVGVVTTAVGLLGVALESGTEDATRHATSLQGISTAAENATDDIDALTEALRRNDEAQRRRSGIGVSTGDVQSGQTELEERQRALQRRLAQAETIFAARTGTAAGSAGFEQSVSRFRGDGASALDTSLLTDQDGQLQYNAGSTSAYAETIGQLRDQLRRTSDELEDYSGALTRATQSQNALGRSGTQIDETGFLSPENRAQRIAARAQEEREHERAAHRSVATTRRTAEEAAEAERQRHLKAKEAENQTELYREQTMERFRNRLQELHDFWNDLDQHSMEAQIGRLDQLHQKQMEFAELSKITQLDKADQAKQQLAETGQITESMWSNIGGTVMDGAGQMIDFIVKGGDLGGKAFQQMLHQFLEATSIQYTIKGLAETAEAVAAAASLNAPQAAAHAAAAGIAFGVAAATGIGAAASAPAMPSMGAGAPAAGSAAGGAGGGGSTQHITIQLYAPNAVMTQAEQGALIATSMREARRQLGEGSVRR